MGEIEERDGFAKIILIMLFIQGMLLLIIEIPLRFIPELLVLIQDIYANEFGTGLWAIASAGFVWMRPRKSETKHWLTVLLFFDIIGSIASFNYEFFFWVITPTRVLLSSIFIVSGFATAFYILTVDFDEPDLITPGHEVFIQEIMMHDSLEEGLDYVLDYIDDPKWEFEPEYKQQFLDYVAERDDELGELVRVRLDKERGL